MSQNQKKIYDTERLLKNLLQKLLMCEQKKNVKWNT